MHSYLINNEIVYLTIADKSYPRKLAFSYLDELSKEFDRSFGGLLDSQLCVVRYSVKLDAGQMKAGNRD